MKFKNWNKQDLTGKWLFTIKLDGVRCHKTKDQYTSRNGKKLYNIPEFEGDVAEIYCGSFKETITKTRTHSKEMDIKLSDVYLLLPQIDKRLIIGEYLNPTKELILSHLKDQLSKGNEGLILIQNDKRIKVKSEYTEDVLIKGFVEGTGKFKNTLGALITENGKIGTGLTNEERNYIWNRRDQLLNTYVEIEFMEKTEDNKFRHPRFVRLRPDK